MCLRGCCPRGPPPNPFSHLSKGLSFPVLATAEREWRRKREWLFYWAPLVHCERSLFFLLTCDLYCWGASRLGRADSWGNCGRADGQLGQFGEREGREWGYERDVRGKQEWACRGRGEEGRKGDEGPFWSFTTLSSLLLGVIAGMERHIALHTFRHLACEKGLAELAVHSICVVAVW